MSGRDLPRLDDDPESGAGGGTLRMIAQAPTAKSAVPPVASVDPYPSERTVVAQPAASLPPDGEEAESERAPLAVHAQAAPVKHVGNRRGLFREQAVENYLTSMQESETLRVSPPWARHILLVSAVLLIASVTATFFVKVEQTGRGRGVLRVAGVQGITSQASGVVLELGARSGDAVAANTLVARIDSTTTKAALLEAEREITRAEEDIASFVARRDAEQAKRLALLEKRIGILGRRAQNQRATVARLNQRVATFDRLAAEGLASALDKSAAENEAAAAERAGLQLQEEISATQLQISNISLELAEDLAKRKATLQKAKDKREALSFQLQQTEVRTPAAGRIEALVTKVGDTIAVGHTIARLLPEGVPREVVAFLPEADRAFLREGTDVKVELDQLPAGEFGSIRAKVTRIGADIATPEEIREALGDSKVEGATYRVELELADTDTIKKLDRLLRPGSLVTARFVLRTRRLATVLFEPLRRFFD